MVKKILLHFVIKQNAFFDNLLIYLLFYDFVTYSFELTSLNFVSQPAHHAGTYLIYRK